MVRSSRLSAFDATWSGGQKDLYTVPAGKVAILRDLVVTPWAVTHAWEWALIAPGPVFYELLPKSFTVVNDTWFLTQMHLVMNAGDLLRAYADNVRWTGYVSGYLLDA